MKRHFFCKKYALILLGDRHMESYEISCKTLALIPIGLNKTRIIEEEKEYNIEKSLMNILDYNCKINGSSYYGRYESSKLLIGLSSKLPILLKEKGREILIPTTSSRNMNCCWISYNNLKDYYKENKNVILVFKNNEKLKIDISIKVFEKQILKVNKLIIKLD